MPTTSTSVRRTASSLASNSSPSPSTSTSTSVRRRPSEPAIFPSSSRVKPPTPTTSSNTTHAPRTRTISSPNRADPAGSASAGGRTNAGSAGNGNGRMRNRTGSGSSSGHGHSSAPSSIVNANGKSNNNGTTSTRKPPSPTRTTTATRAPTRASSASAVSSAQVRPPPVPPRAPGRKASSSTSTSMSSSFTGGVSSPSSATSVASSPHGTTRKKPSLSSPSPVTGPIVPYTTLPTARPRPTGLSPPAAAGAGRRPSTSPISSPSATPTTVTLTQSPTPLSPTSPLNPPTLPHSPSRPSPTTPTDSGRGMIKRLLSKPASHSHSMYSGSESDKPHSHKQKRAWTSEDDCPSPQNANANGRNRRAMSDADDSLSDIGLDAHLASLGLGVRLGSIGGRGSMDTDIEAIAKTRAAVVKRAKEVGNANARLPISSAISRSLSASANATGRVSSPSLRPPPSNSSSRAPSPSGAVPHAPPSRSPTSPTSTAHSSQTGHNTITPTSPTSPSSNKKRNTLTPASLLVEAYKKAERERELEEERRREEREEMKRQSRVLEERIERALREEEERQRATSAPSAVSSRLEPPMKTHTHSRPGTAGSISARMEPVVFEKTQEREHARFYSASTNTSLSMLSMPSRAESRAWAADAGKGFEVIERMHGPDAPPRSRNPSADSMASSQPSALEIKKGERDDEPATPYYTVFGATERVVALGKAEEWNPRYFDSSVLRPVTATSVTASALASTEKDKEKDKTVLKALSRKVSGHWRRIADEDRSAERGRASFQEKRVTRKSSKRDMSVARGGEKGGVSLERDVEEERRKILSRRRSLRLSIDKCSSPVRSESDGHGARTVGSGSGKGCESDEEDYGVVIGSGRKLIKPRRDKEKDTPKEKEKEEKGGSKLWKLMKRISTGGLREKYSQQQQMEDLPPVPALPKEYEQRNGSRSSEGAGFASPLTSSPQHKSPTSSSSYPSPPVLPPISSGAGLARLVSRSSTSTSGATSPPHHASRKTSLSAIRPPPPLSSSFPSTPTSPISTHGASASVSAVQAKPSTRSPSPMSYSDVASSKFFNRTQSTRSSTSSVEEVPPVPKPTIVIGGHIVPPSELGKEESIDRPKKVHPRLGQLNLPLPYGSGSGRRERGSDDWSIDHTPAVELPSLPFPPRRPPGVQTQRSKIANERNDEKDRPASPEIPSFSTVDAVNAFPRRSSVSSKISSPISPHSLSGSVSMSAPVTTIQRPARSAERPAPPRSASPVLPSHTQTQTLISAGRKSESAASPGYSSTSHQRHSSGATMRPWRRSSSFGSKSAKAPGTPTRPSTAVPTSPTSSSFGNSSTSNTRLTFRELGSSGRKHALTEKEKADIWDDLLERSERAGGTIHLGAGDDVLLSDKLSMRMSVASEVPSLG